MNSQKQLCSPDTIYLQHQLEENQKHYQSLKLKIENDRSCREKSKDRTSDQHKVALILDELKINKTTSKSSHNSIFLKNLSSSFLSQSSSKFSSVHVQKMAKEQKKALINPGADIFLRSNQLAEQKEFFAHIPTQIKSCDRSMEESKQKLLSNITPIIKDQQSYDNSISMMGLHTPQPIKHDANRKQIGPVLFSFDFDQKQSPLTMSNLKKEIDSEESSNDANNIIQIESSLSKMKQFFSKNNEKDYSTPNENLKKIQSIYNSQNKQQKLSQRHLSIYVTPQDKENIKPNRIIKIDSQQVKSFQVSLKKDMQIKQQSDSATQIFQGSHFIQTQNMKLKQTHLPFIKMLVRPTPQHTKNNHSYSEMFNQKKRRQLSLFG